MTDTRRFVEGSDDWFSHPKDQGAMSMNLYIMLSLRLGGNEHMLS